MIGFVLLFWMAQSSLDLPHLGYLPGRDGRSWPLYGVRGNFLLGEAVTEPAPSEELAPGRALVREAGHLWLVETTPRGDRLRRMLPDDYLYEVDSTGLLWSAREREVRCEEGRWETSEPVTGFLRLGVGWMAIRTASAIHAVRCGEAELYLLPQPREEDQ